MLKSTYYREPTELDQIVFEQLVPTDHYLRKVKEAVDFESFREQVKDCYSPTMGRGAEDPVCLIKLSFLQFHYTLSDREVIAQAQVNVAFRFFLDLSLDSDLPVPSLLSQFRTRLGVERFEALFDQLVGQARAKGLVKDRLRVKDATHVIANIAIPSTIGLVAQTRHRLLACVRPYAPERVIQEEARADQIRQVTQDLKDEERLVHRVTHLREIVGWVEELCSSLGWSTRLEGSHQRLAEALDLAHKVLYDRAQKEPKDRVLSVVDPQARNGKHGDYFHGYLVDISMDAHSEVITALNVLPGNGDEGGDAPTLIESEQQAHHNPIVELSMDASGWRGEMLRVLSDPQGLDLKVYVPPQVRPTDGIYFTPDDFLLEKTTQRITCPAGQTTSSRHRNSNDTGWKFEFPRRVCAACPKQAQCLSRLPKKKGRSVIKNDYQAEYDAAWTRSKTPRYAQVRTHHRRVEPKLAEIVRHHQGRHTRYRGQDRVKIQYLLTGMVVNIKRIVKLLGAKVLPPTPRWILNPL